MRERARLAVGEHEACDHILDPHLHAERLPLDAAPLKRILDRDEIASIIERYRIYDRKAIRWRRTHVRWGLAGIIGAGLAVVPAVVLMVAPVRLPPVAAALSSAGVWFMLCLAWICFLYLMLRRPLEVWYEARANAEELRKRLFEVVVASDEPAKAGEIDTAALQIEYFRRYQFGVQQAFLSTTSAKYRKRRRRHDAIGKFATAVPFIALLLAAAVIFSAWSEQSLAPSWLAVAVPALQRIELEGYDVFGLAGALLFSSLSAGLFAYAQLDDYRRVGERYAHALARIQDLAEDARFGFLAAHRAAEAGRRHERDRLVREMHAIMSAEFAQWVKFAEADKVAIPKAREMSGSYHYELRIRPPGVSDLVATEKLTAADFEELRAAVGKPLLRARKIGFVSARQAQNEERVVTRWNGKESEARARQGDWVVTNMSPGRQVLLDSDGSPNFYVIEQIRFAQLYERDAGETEHGAIYRSKSVVAAFELPGSFSILAPWGEIQRGAAGFLIRNGDEVYGNNRETFEATYRIEQ
ncbi:MAG: hypothetical protein R3D27_14130 [Hyphomicrobiaceae bacterium]